MNTRSTVVASRKLGLVAAWALVAALAPALAAASDSAQEGGGWQFRLTPYFWASELDGTVGVAGRRVDVDASFDDLLELLDTGGAVRFEMSRGRWGGFADYFGVTLEDGRNVGGATIRAESEQGILETGLSYRIAPAWDLLAGLRHQRLESEIRVPDAVRLGTEERWLDGFIGARWLPVNQSDWRVWLRSDVGSGESDLTWLAAFGASYHFNDTVGIVIAYRYLDTDYENGGFTWDMAQQGLGIGIDLTW